MLLSVGVPTLPTVHIDPTWALAIQLTSGYSSLKNDPYVGTPYPLIILSFDKRVDSVEPVLRLYIWRDIIRARRLGA